jgi:hypothetical protein
VYSASLQGAKALPLPCTEDPSPHRINIYLDIIVTVCLIILLVLAVGYACKQRKKVIQTHTILKLILISDEGEIVLQLGKTVCHIDRTSDLKSDKPEDKPILTLGHKLTIDWKGYAIRTEEGDYELPTKLKIMPWQQNTLRSIIPTLAMMQITALTSNDDTLSWQIFF